MKNLDNLKKAHFFSVVCFCFVSFYFQHFPTCSTCFTLFPSCLNCFYFFQDSCRVKTEQTRQQYQRGPTPVMPLPESSHPGNRTSRLNLDAKAVLHALVWSAAFQIVPRTRIPRSRGPLPTWQKSFVRTLTLTPLLRILGVVERELGFVLGLW